MRLIFRFAPEMLMSLMVAFLLAFLLFRVEKHDCFGSSEFDDAFGSMSNLTDQYPNFNSTYVLNAQPIFEVFSMVGFIQSIFHFSVLLFIVLFIKRLKPKKVSKFGTFFMYLYVYSNAVFFIWFTSLSVMRRFINAIKACSGDYITLKDTQDT